MGDDCWTTRYNPRRLPPPLRLAAPLTLAWRYKPKGVAPGLLRAGDGAVFTTAGKGQATRLELRTGKRVWMTDILTSLLVRWKDELLVDASDPDRLIGLDPGTGQVRWARDLAAGMLNSFVVDDIFVGHVPGRFHAIELGSCQVLWSVPERAGNPLVSDGSVVIRADDDVTCFDLRTGVVRWSRAGAEFGGKCWQMGFIWRDWFLVRVGEPPLLTALELSTGETVWRTEFPVQWCEPYGDRAYGVESTGIYRAIDLATGSVSFEIKLGDVPEPRGPKAGLMVSRPSGSWPWRGATVAVSDSHAFVSKPSGQIVALGRETGKIEQIVEIDGMPASLPVIYENRLLLTDFNAAVYCFEGAP